MSAPLELTTERLLLTTLGPDAAEQAAEYSRANWPFFAPFMPLVPEEYFTTAFQHARLEREERQRSEQQLYRFWLFARDDTQREHVLGDIALSNIVWGAFLSCHLGYKLAQTATNRGLMAEAVRAVVRYAFDELGLHRVEANIMPRNAPSRRVVEKLGFVGDNLHRRLRFAHSVEGGPPELRETMAPLPPVVYRSVERATPTEADLAEYVGHYRSDELDVRYTVLISEGRLGIQRRKYDVTPLTPAYTDAFTGAADVRFTRGENGSVDGFLLTIGRVRNVHFARLPPEHEFA